MGVSGLHEAWVVPGHVSRSIFEGKKKTKKKCFVRRIGTFYDIARNTCSRILTTPAKKKFTSLMLKVLNLQTYKFPHSEKEHSSNCSHILLLCVAFTNLHERWAG